MAKVKIWDISTRLFHWLLVISIFLCWFSMENRWLTVHKMTGYFILFLIGYRLIWGFLGSKTARFSDFITWPWHAIRYLIKSFNQHDDYHNGHNPAGGWMVVTFLMVIVLQIMSGLFANDDVGFSGPLADWVLKETSDLSTQLHIVLFDFLLIFIWLHLVVVFFYVMVKKQNLVKAMVTGKKPKAQTADVTNLFFVSPFRMIITSLIAAIVPLYFLLSM